MFLYQVDAEMENMQKIKGYEEQKLYGANVNSKCEQFYQRKHREAMIFIAEMDGHKLILGAIFNGLQDFDIFINDFLTFINIRCKHISREEITFHQLSWLLYRAEHHDFIEDENKVLKAFRINKLAGSHTGRREFTETIIEDVPDKAQLLKTAEELYCAETLKPELLRIYGGTTRRGVYGHPVHYMVQTDNEEIREKLIYLLICALYINGRIFSKRYCEYSMETGMPFWGERKALHDVYSGGTIVITCSTGETKSDEYISAEAGEIGALCQKIKQHRHETLTILCLPRGCEKYKAALLENLGEITMVTIAEELLSGDKAKNYLRQKAKAQGLPPDKNLYRAIWDSQKGFLTGELKAEFDRWFERKLKTKLFPQYAALQESNRTIADAKPKGSAYEALRQMIGLDEAKEVLAQALDYAKAQKLFQEKGMKADRPAMHLVFTGNPGTAKTTAARLFAQVMKENGLLSKGNLYECGRSDLVGKYVGWTAGIVKEKFQQAKGSVLFIDEAYSLVDDRAGLYGDEAISTIVQEMENQREDLVVIFAGYPDKMEEFLQRNPGLRSRIAFHVHFRDYSLAELCDIAALLAQRKELKLAPDVRDKLLCILKRAIGGDDFGNGRFVRNLLEKARMRQAQRLLREDVEKLSPEVIATLIADDFVAPEERRQATRAIGFSG